jgi:hypothetical protein
MKYLKIQNKGILPLRLLKLIGASTKTGDATKIGEFGTGLKYAIAFFIRKKIDFKLFIGIHEVKITTEDINVNGNLFKEIKINGKHTGITTHYGVQWKAWEAIREVYCNAIDEKNPSVDEGIEEITGKRGHTTFFIEQTDEIYEVVSNWKSYFLHTAGQYVTGINPLYNDENYAIYPNNNEDKALRLYKNGVLIHTSEWHKSTFVYDIKKAPLNELREYKGFIAQDLSKAILGSNHLVGSHLLKNFKPLQDKKQEEQRERLIEVTMDYSYAYDSNGERIKQVFEGYLFLSPESSTKAISEKAIRVHKGLFDKVKSFLPTEDIRYSSYGYYGGGYSGTSRNTTSDISYKLVTNLELEERIVSVLRNLEYNLKFAIAVSIKETFDFIKESKSNIDYLFSSELDKLNDKDLEAVVIIAILDYKKISVYTALKRLIKNSRLNKNLHQILFSDKNQ